MTLEVIVERFEARQNGSGWQARCPAHEDTNPSLSIGEGQNGRVLLKCHAGCSLEAILGAVNLETRDLFPETTRPKTTKPRIVATYDYKDEQDTLLYQSVRYEPKDFKQRRPDGTGGWIWNMKGITRVLYRLPDLRGRRIVLITEGEKDADALVALNYAATTNVGGAGKWRNEYAVWLHTAGVRIVGVLPDNDDPGGKHALQVIKSCRAAGLIATIISLQDLPLKGDVRDYLTTHSSADLEAVITARLTMATTEATLPAPTTTTAPPAVGTEPIDLAGTLLDVETFIRTYVVLSPDQAVLLALWVAQTHAQAAFDYTAYVHVKSPLPECGKTRLLEVLEALVEKPWLTGRVTAAVLMRKVDAEHPTLLLDESDAAFNGDQEYAEALRGMLNSGFHRSGKASACVGQGANLTYKDFATFGPKAIAGIGRLPSTVESRSIPIALKRRTRDELIAKWRRREAWATAVSLRTRLATAMTTCVDVLKTARPELPEGLSDRAEDVLEPLMGIADAAGGDWPQRARLAALELMGHAARVAQESDQSLGLELLTDIRSLFEAKDNPDMLPSADIIQGLIAIEDRPWATFTKGDKPITPHRLARLLKVFGVEKPRKARMGDETVRGYELVTFKDAFARYLPSKAEQAEQPNKTGPRTAKTEVEHGPSVPLSKTAVSPDQYCSVPLVPLLTSDTKEEGDSTTSTADHNGGDDDAYYSGA